MIGRYSHLTFLSVLTVYLGLLTGCENKVTTDPAEPAIIAQVGGQAANIYRQRCSTCHGRGGLGDGTAARALPIKPRNFTIRAWREGVSDTHLRQIIVLGGASVGQSALMPPNPDLKTKPDVVKNLIKILRGL